VIARSNLVLLQRLSAAEADAAAPMLRLSPPTVSVLMSMADDMLAMLTVGDTSPARLLWMAPTSVETLGFGPATR
jgi:hypothetical protein